MTSRTTPASPGAPWGPRAGQARDAEPRTVAGRTAQRLREDIICGRLAPGERLTFDKLARAYGAGSSPLREALFQVAAEGLVHGEDHKGFVVAPIDLGEMLDVSSLRAALETHAATRAIEHAGDDWETALLGAAHRLKKARKALDGATAAARGDAEDEWEHRHREFHYTLCSGCGSPWLLHFFEALYDQLERYRRHFWRYGERAGGADAQHEQIVEAALARDAGRARTLLEAHFARQAELTRGAMQGARASAERATDRSAERTAERAAERASAAPALKRAPRRAPDAPSARAPRSSR